MKTFDLVIIGGGAAGLFAALSASLYTTSIAVIDKNAELGRKIGATGNGKCNFTNSDQNISKYRSSDITYAEQILSRFSFEDTVNKFMQLGIPGRQRKGYYYPVSEQASSVKNILSDEVKNRVREVFLNTEVKKLECTPEGCSLSLLQKVPAAEKTAGKSKAKPNNKTSEYTESFLDIKCKKLIICCGGAASPSFGTDGSFAEQIKKLDIKLLPFSPALTSLLSDDKHLSTISGVRCQSNVSLYSGKDLLGSEAGEIIFNKNGISGIPVMSLSRFCRNSRGNFLPDLHLDIDLLPEYDVYSIESLILRLCRNNHNQSIEQALCGLANYKLLYVLLLKSKTDPVASAHTMNEKTANMLAALIKNFRLPITGDNGFENAQTTSGGVLLSEINPETLESKKHKGLYFAGEVLDVDGTCGGYNLQWAWTTGAIAGACAGGGYFDKDKFLKA